MPENKESRTIFHMIYEFLYSIDSIKCEILILQGFLAFQEDQLGYNSYFVRISYATTILIIWGH